MLHCLSWISQQARDRHIVSTTPGDITSQLIAAPMHDLNSTSNAECSDRTSGVVKASFRCIHESEFGVGEEGRQNHARESCAGADVNDSSAELIKLRRKRRTHGPGEPDRVFDKHLDGRRADDAGRTGGRPGLLKGDQLIVSQHPRRGR